MNNLAVNFEIKVTSSGKQALIQAFDLLPPDTMVVGYRLIERDLLFLYRDDAKDVVLFPAPLNRLQAARMAYIWLSARYKDGYTPSSGSGIYETREYGWHFSTRGLCKLNGQTVGPECIGQVYPTVMQYSSSNE